LEDQQIGTGREARDEYWHEAALPEEQFNIIREDCDTIVKEIDSLIFEEQPMGTGAGATE
jgi:hypothetical protein